jgi:transposase InsO family protein
VRCEATKQHTDQEVLVIHANAPLSELGRFRLARCIVDDGWPLRRAAERFQVSPTTAQRWAQRYRLEGRAGMRDRSSRPHHSPRQTRQPVVRKIVHLRRRKGLGPAMIAGRLGMHASTVHRVLRREGMPRLADTDRATREPIRRYERARPGELVHVDIKKLGNIPDGGGWRIVGQLAGNANRRTTATARGHLYKPVIGYSYVHTAVDDHSRLAYSEVLPDERGATAANFWVRAARWFSERGIHVERVLTDNGACYRSFEFRDALLATGVAHRRTRPYRPQTNGKVERFNRTLLAEWAYTKPYRSESARRAALPAWLHIYNHHRPHTALGGRPPATRVPNLSGQNS